MKFLAPWALLLIIAPWCLAWLRTRINSKGVPNGALVVPDRVAHGAQKAPALYTRLRMALPFIGWIVLCIGLARPVSPIGAPIYPSQARDLVLAIDLSGSMEREDFELDGVVASRIEVVKRVAGEFLRAVVEDRIGMVFFADRASVAAPLSFDGTANAQILDEAQIGLVGRSTAIGDAIGVSVKLFQAAADGENRDRATEDDLPTSRILILLSDGTNNAGAVDPVDATRMAVDNAIVVYTIGLANDSYTNSIGEQKRASYDLDDSTLKAIAEASGGRYFRARTSADLGEIYREISAMERTEVQAPPLIRYAEWSWLVALLVSIIFGFWVWRMR